MYYKVDDSSFPSQSTEALGRFVGIADSVGHALTFKVLTEDTKKVIYRSRIRSARDKSKQNLRVKPDIEEKPPDILKSKNDHAGEGATMPTFDAENLIGRTFLMPPNDDGTRLRVKIVAANY